MKLHKIVLASVAAVVLSGAAMAQQEYVIRIGGGHPTAVTYVNQFDIYFVPEVVKQALTIAADLCIYTNQNHVIEVLE